MAEFHPGGLPTSDGQTQVSSAQSDFSRITEGDIRVHDTSSIDQNEATNDSDSDSDISMSTDSSDDDSNLHHRPLSTGHGASVIKSVQSSPPIGVTPPLVAADPSRKRRFSPQPDLEGARVSNVDRTESSKRQKLKYTSSREPQHGGDDRSSLPAGIWHHILSFCRPKVLGKMLCVNRSFNGYLDPSVISVTASPTSFPLKPLTPDEIWRKARLRCLNNAPGPLRDTSELQMWKLACGRSCQYCTKAIILPRNSVQDQWHLGPGVHGNSPIWQFNVRSCGACLEENTIKEIDLLLSASVSPPLISALPHIFLTNELHVVPSALLQGNQHPPSIQITKRFLNEHVKDIKQQAEDVKALGSAAAEEWIKGLESLGKTRRNDAARWERWSASGGLDQMQGLQDDIIEVSRHLSSSFTSANVALSISNINLAPNGFNPQLHGQSQKILPETPIQHHPTTRKFDVSRQGGAHQIPPRPNQPRMEKTKEQAIELKALRKAEIERRSGRLDPPLTPEVLAHMPSFQAAIQLTQPMTDSAWEILRPRLLSQREDAERREKEQQTQVHLIKGRVDATNLGNTGASTVDNDEWEDVQTAIRLRLAGFADEIIGDGWAGGTKVKFDSCPSFAANVLVYVRNRFYAEVTKDDAAILASGRMVKQDPPDGPFTKKLVLEDMKWVFDTKIKPITEAHRKEIFLCNDCDFPNKYYGFEGIIQHYAAKHTSALSSGSIVVQWKSEWPQHTPFNQNPSEVNSIYNNAIGQGAFTYDTPLPQRSDYPGFQTVHSGASHQYSQPAGQQTPYYQGQTHLEMYPNQGGSQYFGSTPLHSQYSNIMPHHALLPVLQHIQPSYVAHVAPVGGYYSLDHHSYPHPVHTTTYAAEYVIENASSALSGDNNIHAQNFGNVTDEPRPDEYYKMQLQYLARISREIWTLVSSLKEVPGSVKVYTIVYHSVARFRAEFQEDLSLSLLADGLNNHKDMRPVRNVNGLRCKACSMELNGSLPMAARKHLSFPQLVNHFLLAHEDNNSIGNNYPLPDWTKHLVELPEVSRLRNIPGIPGMDDQRLKMYGEALPEIFTVPEPMATVHSPLPDPHQQYYSSALQPHSIELAPSFDKHDTYYGSKDDVPDVSQTPTGQPPEDEYDPRHPQVIDLRARPLPKTTFKEQHKADQNNQPLRADQTQATHFRADQERHSLTHFQGSGEERRDLRGDVVDMEPPHNMPKRTLPEEEYGSTRSIRPRMEPRAYIPGNHRVLEANRRPVQDSHSYRYSDGHRPASSTLGKIDPTSNVLDVLTKIQEHAKIAQEQSLQSPTNQPLDAYSEDGEIDEFSLATANHDSVGSKRNIQPLYTTVRDSHKELVGDYEPLASKHENGSTRYVENRGSVIKPESDSRDGRGYQHEKQVDTIYRSTNERGQWYGERMTEQAYRNSFDEKPVITGSRARATPVYMTSAAEHSIQGYSKSRGKVIPNEAPHGKENSTPVPVDPRYKQNNVIYRQGSIRRTPNRFARYESVRLEGERQHEAERSRSPVCIDTAAPLRSRSRERRPPSGYRVRSPRLQYYDAEQEPVYEHIASVQRQDYRGEDDGDAYEHERVYTRREPQYEEVYELVHVSDPRGDYMIRQFVGTRRIMEPIYVPQYEDEDYAPRGRRAIYVDERQPVYDDRRPVYESRNRGEERRNAIMDGNVAGDEEEYDPKRPEALSNAPVQRLRYQ